MRRPLLSAVAAQAVASVLLLSPVVTGAALARLLLRYADPEANVSASPWPGHS